MALRIVPEPLLLGPDGQLLPRGLHLFSAYALDPLNLTPSGLQEALNAGADAKHVAEFITRYLPENLAYYEQHALQRRGLSELQEEILALPAEERAPRVEQVITRLQDEAQLRDSAVMLARLAQRREQARVADAGIIDSTHYAPPEGNAMLFRQLVDSGYKGDVDFESSSLRQKVKIRKALEAMPTLAACADAEGLTVTSVDSLFDALRVHGFSDYQSKMVGIDKKTLLESDMPAVERILKEELLHYMDLKFGVSTDPHNQEATRRLLEDDARLDAIDAYAALTHQNKKNTLRNMNARKMPIDGLTSEVLAEYLHIRDHLRAEQKSGCLGQFMPGAKRAMERQVDQKLEELFGHELQVKFQQFEAQIEAHAAQGRSAIR